MDKLICPVALRTGKDDAVFGYAAEENPFLMPENREAWERGWRSTPEHKRGSRPIERR